MPNRKPVRQPTQVDEIAEKWVDTLVQLSPETGTYIGHKDTRNVFSDYSPAGAAVSRAAMVATLKDLNSAIIADDVDHVTVADLTSELTSSIESIDEGDYQCDLNVIASPAQGIREIFDLMSADTVQDWDHIRERLNDVPRALRSYMDSLEEGVREGNTPALRQVEAVIVQVERLAGVDSFFKSFVEQSEQVAEDYVALGMELKDSAVNAAAAYDEFADFLTGVLAPAAKDEDAAGREKYARASESFLGLKVDLDEVYEWGLEELARTVEAQELTAGLILGGNNRGNVLEAIDFLDGDVSRKIFGTESLKHWMQETSDTAVKALNGTHFDIPEQILSLECMIAPSASGGIYYTGPTDDFSRPGRMWWSVPEDVVEFNTWRELTTVNHEGVPGHHLQIGTAVANAGSLNTWRRQLAGTSGHAEGWALYGEKLMEELGFLEDPANMLGMLDGQRMRAARVVLDIGVHLGKVRPDGSGKVWDADYALNFFREHVHMNDSFIKFEVNRYLGWYGQAPSYKIGQRVWEEIRAQESARLGEGFVLKDFHTKALNIGGVRLDTLQKVFK